MKKKYLHCTVYKHNGDVFFNPLKLSESSIINTLVKENQKVEIVLSITTKENYKCMFG